MVDPISGQSVDPAKVPDFDHARAEGATILKQALGLVGVIAWSAIGTFAVLMICNFTTGLRVSKENEIEGLDYSQHGETLHS